MTLTRKEKFVLRTSIIILENYQNIYCCQADDSNDMSIFFKQNKTKQIIIIIIIIIEYYLQQFLFSALRVAVIFLFFLIRIDSRAMFYMP